MVIGGTRLLEAAAAASIPSILGYIALATSGDQSIRGRAVSRFEAATLLGIGFGIVAAGPIFVAIGRVGFVINAGIYVLSFLIYRWGVAELHHAPESDDAADDRGGRPQRLDLGRYRRIPGFVAGLAAGPDLDRAERGARLLDHPIGLPAGARPAAGIQQPAADAGDQPHQRERRLRGGRVGVRGRAVVLGQSVQALSADEHHRHWPCWRAGHARRRPGAQPLGGLADARPAGTGRGGGIGLFVMSGATPAALGLLADITESYPADRGAIMGLYSVFLGVGQILGALVSGPAGDAAGIDGLFITSSVLIVIALLPLNRLRSSEHLVGARLVAAR